jgi:hypothetical protein
MTKIGVEMQHAAAFEADGHSRACYEPSMAAEAPSGIVERVLRLSL